MKKLILAVLLLLSVMPGITAAADEQSWLTVGGDYRFRFDELKGRVQPYNDSGIITGTPGPQSGYSVKNSSLMLNRFGLNLRADAVEDISVKARFLMYKVWGHETSNPVEGQFFPDKAFGPNDGTIGHVPSDNSLRVDYGYATVSNIFNAPVWFSVGRRPSTGGVPSNLRQNREKIGTAGSPSIMVDYAFDGMTLGYAPDLEALPGIYAKLCYGKGFDSGFTRPGMNLKDTDFYGIDLAVIDTEMVHVELQYQKGSHIADTPSDGITSLPTGTVIPVSENLGSIDWIGGVVTGKIGPLNLFLSAAESKTKPNDNTFNKNSTPWGLLWTRPPDGAGPQSATGSAIYLGGRYDIDHTKIGLEYNHGSKNWAGMVPAGDDIWTSKLGTRGNVYEIYLIQELDRKPVSKNGKAYVRAGYQYSRFNYTGSNFWIGEPKKISDLNETAGSALQILVPVKDAKDLYLTFDLIF